MKINELLKKIREDRREENRENFSKFMELNKDKEESLKKEISYINNSIKKQFDEYMNPGPRDGEYLDKILSLRARLENLASEYIKGFEEVKDLIGSHNFYTDYDGELCFSYEISFEAKETEEEFTKRIRSIISTGYIPTYKDLEPYDLIEKLTINSDRVFSIVYENIEYKYLIHSEKLKDKILKNLETKNFSLAYSQLISGGTTIELI